MKACVDEYENCEIKEIKNKYLVRDPLVSKIAVDPDETNLTLLRGLNTEDGTIKEGEERTLSKSIRNLIEIA